MKKERCEALVGFRGKVSQKPKRLILMGPEAENCTQMGRFGGNGALAL